MTRFAREYLEFRESLNNRDLENLRAHINNLTIAGLIQEDVLTVAELGAGAKFHIYFDKNRGTLWFLGGHWVRSGEPTAYYLQRMGIYADQLRDTGRIDGES